MILWGESTDFSCDLGAQGSAFSLQTHMRKQSVVGPGKITVPSPKELSQEYRACQLALCGCSFTLCLECRDLWPWVICTDPRETVEGLILLNKDKGINGDWALTKCLLVFLALITSIWKTVQMFFGQLLTLLKNIFFFFFLPHSLEGLHWRAITHFEAWKRPWLWSSCYLGTPSCPLCLVTQVWLTTSVKHHFFHKPVQRLPPQGPAAIIYTPVPERLAVRLPGPVNTNWFVLPNCSEPPALSLCTCLINVHGWRDSDCWIYAAGSIKSYRGTGLT